MHESCQDGMTSLELKSTKLAQYTHVQGCTTPGAILHADAAALKTLSKQLGKGHGSIHACTF
jgi:hypothetical protein